MTKTINDANEQLIGVVQRSDNLTKKRRKMKKNWNNKTKETRGTKRGNIRITAENRR